MAKNTKHVGLLLLLLLVFVKLFFYFFLGKCGFSFYPGLREGRKLSSASPAGDLRNLHLVSSQADFPRRPSHVVNVQGNEAPGGAQLPDTAFPCNPIICPLGRWTPPFTGPRLTTPTPPPGVPPPLPGALPVALNNDICMQGAIHKYVTAGEI